jgi:DNA-binding SARP family transcriptional activator
MLKILLLGTPVILYEDQPLRIQRRQLRTMLCYLACQPEGIGRGEILGRFWPDKTESVGRRQLREVLSKLRAQIPDPEILQTDLDRVWLNRECVYSDVIEYQELVQPLPRFFELPQVKSSLPDNLADRLEQAVRLWRSADFWSGERSSSSPEFDNWLQETAASLQFNRVQNLERLANHFAALTEFDRAIFYTQKALETDEYNEELQEQLLSWLYQAGRISEAQTFYSYLMDVYKREYDEDLPESFKHTVHLAAQYTFEDQKPTDIQWRLESNRNQHFVGRAEELQLLKKKFLQGDVVFIIGEAGAGKTRLVQQFFNTHERKPRLLLATCHPLESDLPLHPLIDLIRNYIKEEDWITLEPQWLQALSVLAPGIVRSPKSSFVSTASSPDQSRSILFEAIRQLFMAVSRSSRILFVLDDAQWSDLGTLEVVKYLIERSFFTNHGLCIVNARPDIQNSQIQEQFFVNQQHFPITRIDLDFMDREEIAELVRYTLGQTPTEAFLQRISEATGGNPLFIIETINALLISTSDYSTIQDQSDLPLANSISLIVKEKEANISEAARRVLSIAAICGMKFQIEVLELIEGVDPDDLVRSLEELEDQRLIQPVLKPGLPGWYSFVHSLIREAVTSRLSHARQCLLHNQIATAMSASQSHISKQQASVIARHYEEAGRPLPAFRNWVKAGQYARGLFATFEAYAAFRHADSIRSRMESALSEDDLYSLYSEWGDLAYTVMDLPTLTECYTAMHSAGEQKKSSLLIGAGLSGLAVPAALSLDIERALVLLEQSIAVLSQTDHSFEKIQAFSRMGIGLSIALQYQKAVEMYLLAIELGKDLATPAIRQAVATVQYQLSILYSLIGWPQKALETGKQALKNSYLLVSNPTAQSQSHLTLAMAYFFSGDFSRVQEHYRKCLQIAEAMQNYRVATLAYLVEARASLITGRLGEAWDLAQKALNISSENGFFENISEAHCVMGDFYRLLDNYPDAIEEYRLGSEGLLESFQGMNSYYRLGYVTARNGDTLRGLEILDHVIKFSETVGLESILLQAQAFRAMILQDIGKTEEAREIFSQTVSEAKIRGLETVIIDLNHYNAKYMIDPGDTSDIEHTINRLTQQNGGFENLWLKALAQEMKARLEYNSKDNDQKMADLIFFLEDIIRPAKKSENKPVK